MRCIPLTLGAKGNNLKIISTEALKMTRWNECETSVNQPLSRIHPWKPTIKPTEQYYISEHLNLIILLY